MVQGTRVYFEIPNSDTGGIGTVVGKSSELPILGGMYIIQPDGLFPNEVYPYTHFVCPECYLELLDPSKVCSMS